MKIHFVPTIIRLQASCDAIDTFDSLDKLRQCLLWSEQFARDALILGYGSNVVLQSFTQNGFV